MPLTYTVEVYSNSALTTLVLAASGIADNAPPWTLWQLTPPLPKPATYYWRVRAHDGQLPSAWSATQSFRYVRLRAGVTGIQVAAVGDVSGLLSASTTEQISYYHTDHLGTPILMTNDAGQVVWQAEYLPFGEMASLNEDVDGDGMPVVNNLRFPGQYFDQETDLHYNMARTYYPNIGRYAEADPIGLDWGEGTVEHIAEDRKQESLDGYDTGLSKQQLHGIEAVAMDMWEPYIQATLARVPAAAGKIVFDRFHVMGYLGKAVDTVRKQEHRGLMESGDETLKGSKYLWLYSRENVPERRRDEFAALMRQELKVGRAWAIKEALRRLWRYVYPASGRKFWKRWYFWATHSRLEPIRKAAETVRRHIDNILIYYQHPVTTAMSEGLNSQIQKIKSMACGFRNIENFKTAIYFRCGGLDLYPC